MPRSSQSKDALPRRKPVASDSRSSTCDDATMPPGCRSTGRLVFYARVSTRDQKADLQLDAARKLGIPTEDIFVETASGKRDDRPVLNHVLAEVLQPGDTLVCWTGPLKMASRPKGVLANPGAS